MKKNRSNKILLKTLGIFIFLFLSHFSQAQNSATDNRSADKAAIMKSINDETDCFYASDYACWKEHWVNDVNDFQGWSNRDGTFDTHVGWESIDASIKKYIAENPVSAKVRRKVERRNIRFKFYGDLACFMTWDQYQEDREGKNYFHSHEIRVMEKHDKMWQIASVAAFWDYKNLVPITDLKPE